MEGWVTIPHHAIAFGVVKSNVARPKWVVSRLANSEPAARLADVEGGDHQLSGAANRADV
jgi:hypothetical protein